MAVVVSAKAGLSASASPAPTAVIEAWSDPLARYTLHAMDANRMSVAEILPSPLRYEAQFTVLTGDDVNGWGGERAEVIVGGGSTRWKVRNGDGTEYYRLSVRLPVGWESPDNGGSGRWGLFFQLHGPDALLAPPSIALAAESAFKLNLLGGDVLVEDTSSHAFSNGALSLGSNVDFIMKVRWAPDDEGSVAIYRLTAGQWVEVLNLPNTPTLQYSGVDPVGVHYWKAGFYRSASDHTNVVTLGPIVRAKSFEAAAYF